MAKFRILVILIGFIFAVTMEPSSQQANASFMIIVHPESPLKKIDRWELSAIFLGKKTLWREEDRVYPCMLREDQPSMKEFISTIHSKSVGQYRAYWKKRLFSGGGTIPKTFHRSQTLIDYVSTRPGAIGVLPTQKVNKEVKVLYLEW